MLNAKSISLRRKSFGGQTGIGIWWRKRSAPTSVPAEEDEGPDKKKRNQELSDPFTTDPASENSPGNTEEQRTAKTKKKKQKKGASAAKTTTTTITTSLFRTAEEAPILGWDDDLCRPIYHHHRDANNDPIDNDLVRAVSSGGSGVVDDTETDTSVDMIDEDLLGSCDDTGSCLDEEKGVTNAYPIATCPSVVGSEESAACEATTSVQDKSGVSFRIPVLSRKRTRTFGNRKQRRRPLSLILTQEEEETPSMFDRGSRRISLESSADTAPIEEKEVSDARSNSSEDPDSKSNSDDRLAFRTDGESNQKQPKKRRRSKKPRSDPDNSLEKAREYFANLDHTQTLTLDAASSPPVSSKVTRTRRRTNLASPGINREYRAYAKSIAGDGDSGISPLSIRDYASSRKLYFQNKGEIVDGSLDDD